MAIRKTIRRAIFPAHSTAILGLLALSSLLWAGCKETQEPIHRETAVCKPNDTRPRPCGLNGAGIQTQGCQEGRWSNMGQCDDPDSCITGKTRFRTCGDDSAGQQMQYCEDGQWEDSGSCKEDATCTEGDTRNTECGLNGNGTRTSTCNDGKWTHDANCNDPDACRNHTVQYVTCGGTNGNALQKQRCDDGAWTDIGSCEDKDACENGTTRSEPCGGLNGNARRDELCQDGQWEPNGSCDDPDVCTNGSSKKETCGGRNGNAQQTYTCAGGQWQESGGCDDPDVCTNGDSTVENCGGFNGNATRTNTCEHGQWNLGTCNDPDVCQNGDTNSAVCGESNYGVGTTTCANGQWNAATDCHLEVSTFDANATHACAVVHNGDLVCWGKNTNGQLGDGTHTASNYPIPVNLPDNTSIAQVSTGYAHTCLTTWDDDIYCWGDGSSLQTGVRTGDATIPGLVTSLSGLHPGAIMDIETGRNHTCVLDDKNLVYCWGNNTYGQLGVAASVPSDIAVKVPFFTSSHKAVQITTGWDHTCALLSDGTIDCWGYNDRGQLGDGTTTDSNQTQVLDIGGSNPKAILVSAGRNYTCAVTEDDDILCWGDNQHYQLDADVPPANAGDPSPDFSSTPIQTDFAPVSNTSITQLATGAQTACILTSQNAIYCWGDNTEGSAGVDPSATTTVHPSQAIDILSYVSDPNISVTSIHFRGETPCAMLSDLSLWCWGDNANGVLGRGNVPSDYEPAPIEYPNN